MQIQTLMEQYLYNIIIEIWVFFVPLALTFVKYPRNTKIFLVRQLKKEVTFPSVMPPFPFSPHSNPRGWTLVTSRTWCKVTEELLNFIWVVLKHWWWYILLRNIFKSLKVMESNKDHVLMSYSLSIYFINVVLVSLPQWSVLFITRTTYLLFDVNFHAAL